MFEVRTRGKEKSKLVGNEIRAVSDMRIVVVDYGMGNLQSVVNALKFLGCSAAISSDAGVVDEADVVILPGVGAFGEAMNNLRELRIIDALNRHVMERKKPFLGICLGMQLTALDSMENGRYDGLGWISGHVRMIPVPPHLRLPHIGWNDIKITGQTSLFDGITKDFNFYFVHSFQMECDDSYIIAKCDYGVGVTAAIQHNNIFATQFHPEKSQENGLRVLRNFVNYCQASRG